MRRGGGIRGSIRSGGRGSFRSGIRLGGHSRGFRTHHRHHARYNRGHSYGRGYYGYRNGVGGGFGGLIIFGIFIFIIVGASTGLLGLLALMFIIGIIGYTVRENKKSSFSSNPNRKYIKNQNQKQTLETQYYQRPAPTFCSGCGSGILPNSEFCTECGIKVT